MAVSKLPQDNKARIEKHSQRIAAVEQQQIEFGRTLNSIDKKLSEEFFDKVEALYDYVIVGNGVTSLKSWRNEVDRERAQAKEKDKDKMGEVRKWIFYIVTYAVATVTTYFMVNR